MKRFTETQKWEDPWFRKLRPELKLLWQWILDRCDNAGVIDPDLDLASFQIGYQYPMDTLSEFDGRVVTLPGGKFFIPKFIEFQYGRLSEDCKAHRPIFQSLEKHQIKGYPKGIHTLQEKEKEKEKEKVKATRRKSDPFAKVEINTPTMILIGGWFNRKPTNLWSKEDAAKLAAIDPDPDDIAALDHWYQQTRAKVIEVSGHDSRQTALPTLLNNWQTAADRARAFQADSGQ